MSTRSETGIICVIGCANPEMIHRNAEFQCDRMGYTAFHCKQHRCPQGGLCCTPITARKLEKGFHAFCDTCGKRADFRHAGKFADGALINVFYCRGHEHKGKNCCITITRYIADVIELLEKEKGMGKGKKDKDKEEDKSESKNRRGDPCPNKKRFKDGKNKGKKMKRRCGNVSVYYCSKQRQFLCFECNHLTSSRFEDEDRDCCVYISERPYVSEYNPRNEFGHSYDTGSTGELGEEPEEKEEKPTTPCTVCKEEGDYWCKKNNQWRCGQHYHTRWECCDWVASDESGKKVIREVKFENADA